MQDLYARYDGPIPRESWKPGKGAYRQMIRREIRTIRSREKAGWSVDEHKAYVAQIWPIYRGAV
jgi:hypothetical protein